MKPSESTSLSLFTFYSYFAAIHRASRDIFVTAEEPLPLTQEIAGSGPPLRRTGRTLLPLLAARRESNPQPQSSTMEERMLY
jgi:hypothetical protein